MKNNVMHNIFTLEIHFKLLFWGNRVLEDVRQRLNHMKNENSMLWRMILPLIQTYDYTYAKYCMYHRFFFWGG